MSSSCCARPSAHCSRRCFSRIAAGRAASSAAGSHPALPPTAAPTEHAGNGNQQQQLQQQQQQATSSTSSYQFTYRGSDGRMKGTFEQAFKGVRPGTHSEQPAPWALGYQMREGDTGLWNNDLKARLLKRAVSEELGISEEEVEARLDSLQVLLPAIKAKLAGMRAVLVTRLVADIDLLPARLMRLKAIFPGAAAGVLAMREPGLVLGYDLDVLQATAEELRRMLPSLDIDRLVQENPAMLDVAGLKAAMAEAQRIMPHLDCERAMATDPQLIFGFQTGSQLIPYDPPRPVEQENDDDEYAAYYK